MITKPVKYNKMFYTRSKFIFRKENLEYYQILIDSMYLLLIFRITYMVLKFRIENNNVNVKIFIMY